MRPPFLEALFRPSFSEVGAAASHSDPNGSGKNARQQSGRPAGAPVESYTERQQPHTAIFRIECARIELA